MKKEKAKTGIIQQVAVLSVFAVMFMGVATYFTQHEMSDRNVQKQMEMAASETAGEVTMALEEYPAEEWLIRYWYEHCDEMDIEYDTDYRTSTVTREKDRLLAQRHPDLQVRYASVEEIEALPAEDQKLYAEAAYSWLITRVNEIKQAHDVDYLFCVLTEEPYDQQFFLFSGADPGAIRGTEYEEVYPLGKTVSVSASQQEAMKNACENDEHLADAGAYVDYYSRLGTVDGHQVLIGMTYNLSDIKADVNTQTMKGTVYSVGQQIALLGICLAMIFLLVLQPLNSVEQNIRYYMQEKDGETVRKNLSQLEVRNEIGQLAEDVIDMTSEIDEHVSHIEKITAEREHLAAEMNMAARIQTNSLPNVFPPFPERKEFDIFASMDPAKEVGGDFYDFFMIDDDHLALLIADVSGKGVPAALFMMTSMILIHNAATDKLSPGTVLEFINNQICDRNPEEMFISIWMGVLEISTGKLIAANAGHEYPMVRYEDTFELLKDRHGFVIGGLKDMKYMEYTLQLQPGSRVFVYTDGLDEAMNGKLEKFGTARILDVLNSNPDATDEEMLSCMQKAVDVFTDGTEQFDDLTMMSFTWHGPAKTL
ncbi:MAG: serine/threonine-protein phosphatase [Solobacterium sp.]|nr:serine/threonine-protein phosphatase [Solobacterium sp.]